MGARCGAPRRSHQPERPRQRAISPPTAAPRSCDTARLPPWCPLFCWDRDRASPQRSLRRLGHSVPAMRTCQAVPLCGGMASRKRDACGHSQRCRGARGRREDVSCLQEGTIGAVRNVSVKCWLGGHVVREGRAGAWSLVDKASRADRPGLVRAHHTTCPGHGHSNPTARTTAEGGVTAL
jgi:hypothetical protein